MAVHCENFFNTSYHFFTYSCLVNINLIYKSDIDIKKILIACIICVLAIAKTLASLLNYSL